MTQSSQPVTSLYVSFMSAPQTCTRGHRSGLVRPDGLLKVQGREYARYRCEEPDGSFHRFMVLAADGPAAAPRSVVNGDETAVMPPLVARLVARAAVQVPSPRPVPPLPRRHRPLPSMDLPAADSTVVLDPASFEAPASAPAIVRSSVEGPSAERTPRVLVLPAPPTDEEKYWYFGAQNRWFLWAGTGAGLLVLASLVRFALDRPITWAFLGLVLLRVVTTAVGVITSSRRRRVDGIDHDARVLTWQPEELPSVDVFLPSAGEELDVLANTYFHVSRLEWEGPLEVHVLDDSARPEVADLAAGYGFTYHSRPDRGVMKKAGNLKYGFEHSTGDVIAVLDADFVPRPDYLYELVPYFEDAEVGIVQSPQFFRVLDQQNWIERGAGAVQELFYRAVQTSRQHNDGAICVGSCALYRRAALAENGGTTLIEHSEDVHTGFDLRRLGWDLRYVPLALSAGLCPDSVAAFHNQQYRWCAGSMSLLASRKFWTSKLRLRSRLCYLSGFLYYVHTALFTFAGPLIPITLLVAMPELLELRNARLVLPSLVYTTVVFPWWHRSPYRLEAWACRMMYGWAHTFAIWDLLRGRRLGWRPTGSATAASRRTGDRRPRLGIVLWGGGTALLWVGAALWRMVTGDPVDCALVLSSGLFYALVVGRVLVQPRPVAT